MELDLQLSAYSKLFESSVEDESEAISILKNEFQELEPSAIQEAIDIARRARIAHSNTASTYELASASEAACAAQTHIIGVVPNISTQLLNHLIFKTMRSWAY